MVLVISIYLYIEDIILQYADLRVTGNKLVPWRKRVTIIETTFRNRGWLTQKNIERLTALKKQMSEFEDYLIGLKINAKTIIITNT